MNKEGKFLRKILRFNSLIFPFLVPLTYLFLFLETYSYIGFLRKFFLVDSRFFLAVSLVSVMGVIFERFVFGEKVKKEGGERLINLAFGLNFLVTPVFIIFYFILMGIENKNYPNYVFSRFHLQPDNFFNLVLMSIFLLLGGLLYFSAETERGRVRNFFLDLLHKSGINFNFSTTRVGYRESFVILFLFVSVFLLLVYFIENLSQTLPLAIKNDLYIFTHLDDSYDDKMRKTLGFYYDFMRFVDDYTEEGAVIVLPPNKSPWLSEGNPNLSRYFLYPKYVLNGEESSLPGEDFDYVVVAKGSWDREGKSKGWPRFFVEAKRVFFYSGTTKEVKVVNGDFYPELMDLYGGWGLIEVKKE